MWLFMNLCISCHRNDVRDRYQHDKSKYQKQRIKSRMKVKSKLIQSCGGACSICGYKFNGENYAAFDFHHINPHTKDSMISRDNYKEAKKEIEKCILLCSNCHRIIHSSKMRNG